MSAVVQFMSAADHVLGIEERLVELVDHLVELHQRLDTLEALAVENAGADPLTEILARLDAFETRLTKLETRQRRPPPFPITVVENVPVGSKAQRQLDALGRTMDELSRELTTERYQRACGERDLNQRLNQCAAQFVKMRERVTAVEARTASDDKQGATP
jgi:hypothetical protein